MKRFRIESMTGPFCVSQSVTEAKSHMHALQALLEREVGRGAGGGRGFYHLADEEVYPKDAISVVLTVWETEEDDYGDD